VILRELSLLPRLPPFSSLEVRLHICFEFFGFGAEDCLHVVADDSNPGGAEDFDSQRLIVPGRYAASR
jgi:hypothetical protein